MANLKLTAYQGIDPEGGTGVYMVTIHDPDTPDNIDCIAMRVDENSTEAINDPEGVKIVLSVGIWRAGKARPIAHQFLAMETTKQLWQIDVQGGAK